jgi:hypothetical protein
MKRESPTSISGRGSIKAAEDDIEVEFVKKPHSHKRKKSPHKGYFNNQLSVMRR